MSDTGLDCVRLLILDDEPALARTMVAIAETAGAVSRSSTGAADFFEAVRTWNPTHIALDLVMPGMDGVEVLGLLAERECPASIILTSGVGDRVLAAAARSAQERGLRIAGILAKPFTPGMLRELIAKPQEHDPPAARQSASAPSRRLTPASLKQAIGGNELQVYYQPKVGCHTGELAGFEALVRWIHPEYGFLLPDQFIALAETNSLMGALTFEVFEQSLRWFSGRVGDRLAPIDTPEPRLAVNISALNLDDERFVERVTASCARNDVDPGRVIFELTETSAMGDPVNSLAMLTRLRMKGFHLAIDDFGTGFSSMLQLVRLPFSEIKIDKSFVMGAISSQESRTVVKSIVDLGHSLGLITTAEGVENQETLTFLRDIGCDLAQGYLFGRPMAGEHIRF